MLSSANIDFGGILIDLILIVFFWIWNTLYVICRHCSSCKEANTDGRILFPILCGIGCYWTGCRRIAGLYMGDVIIVK